jgi:putative hydrolase of the HAD superfamily
VSRDRAILFDLDDTLYAERRFVLSGYAAVAAHAEASLGLDRRQVFAVLRDALRRRARPVAFQLACERFRVDPAVVPLWREILRTHAPRLRLPVASRAVLEAMRPRWRLGILTNGLPAVQRRKVHALGVDRQVDCVVYAAEHGGVGKPRPEPFLAAAAALRLAPHRVVMVGNDLDLDVGGATGAGLNAIWLDPTHRADAGHSPSAVVAALRDVPAAADRILDEARIHVA